MKLTRDRLKQIIKEELEEIKGGYRDVMTGEPISGGHDEKRHPSSAVPSAPDKPKTASQPSQPETVPMARKFFNLKLTDPEMISIKNLVGNLISSIESGKDTAHDLQRLKDVLRGKE